jgi:ferredoxin
VFGRLSQDLGQLAWMRVIPPLPSRLRRVTPPAPWPARRQAAPPAELQTVAGIWRDSAAEDAAFAIAPLHDFPRTHHESLAAMLRQGWHYVLPTAPRLMREFRRAEQIWRRPPRRIGETDTPERRVELLRSAAARLGLAAIGFADYDPRYVLAEYAGSHHTGSVIVCLFEQDWAATQTAPSTRAERAAMTAYGELQRRVNALAEVAQDLGIDAQPHDTGGQSIVIHYAQQAGLGQLGLNGQLLTPVAGSRVRIALITTDAELPGDGPQDFGVHAICDACQACVRRCPVGAIPRQRKPHRGVTKAKIKTERCFPVVVQAEGCAVCMKVCPVQRYGLDSVTKHFVANDSAILGVGTDELEGYTWPLDGRYYRPGQKPRIDSGALLRPPGWDFDPNRTAPPLARG